MTRSALSLALGLGLGVAVPAASSLWPFVAFLAVLTLLFGYGLALRGWWFAFVALVGVVLSLEASGRRLSALRTPDDGRGRWSASLVVGDPVEVGPVAAEGLRWASFVTEVEGTRLKVVLPQHPADRPPAVGETWRCVGWLSREKGGGPRMLWVKGRGTSAVRTRPAPWFCPAAWAGALRRELSRRAGLGLARRSEAAALNRAILLGERARLPRATREDFVLAGTVHVFAISGLHVMIVARLLACFMALTLVPVRFHGLLVVPVLWAYVLAIGLPPSAIRAASMATIMFAAPLFWRRPDALTAWSATFLACHLLRPLMIAEVGSLLSFAVMLGIVLFLRWMRDLGWRRGEWLGVSLAAWAAGVPIAAHVFGRVTPGGILANLAMVPAAGVSVCSGVLGLFASVFCEPLAARLNRLAALATEIMSGLSHLVARIPGASFETEAWTLWDCFAWYAVVILSLWLVRSVVLRRRTEALCRA